MDIGLNRPDHRPQGYIGEIHIYTRQPTPGPKWSNLMVSKRGQPHIAKRQKENHSNVDHKTIAATLLNKTD